MPKKRGQSNTTVAEDVASIARDAVTMGSGLLGRAARSIRGRAQQLEDAEIGRKRENQTTDSNNR